jgi:hypothetical protein
MKKITLLLTFIFLSCSSSPTGSGGSSINTINFSTTSTSDTESIQQGNSLIFGLFQPSYNDGVGWSTDLDINVDVSGNFSYVECFINNTSIGKNYSEPLQWTVDVFQDYIPSGQKSIRIELVKDDGEVLTSNTSVELKKYYFFRARVTDSGASNSDRYSVSFSKNAGTLTYGPPYHLSHVTENLDEGESSDELYLQEGVYLVNVRKNSSIFRTYELTVGPPNEDFGLQFLNL